MLTLLPSTKLVVDSSGYVPLIERDTASRERMPLVAGLTECAPGSGRDVEASPSPVNIGVYLLIRAVVNGLDSLAGLQPGWDGYRAPAINQDTIQFAKELFARVAHAGLPTPSVVPTVSGGIQFEWHTQRRHVELEVEAPDQFILFIVDRDTGHSDLDESGNVDRVRAAIALALFT